ncbi:MAG TPA: hypothetical protein VHV74_04140 [Pseudonocardiaceae bacterium]|jgi:hypothetical protein|nr:hypothetical protein [Pseudonocardiaceae bacterium]
MTTARRVSVTLDGSDQRAIEAFADPSRPEHATLEAWASRHDLNLRDESDAAVLRALIRAGAEALQEKALEDGYDLLAKSRAGDERERRFLRGRSLRRMDGPAE